MKLHKHTNRRFCSCNLFWSSRWWFYSLAYQIRFKVVEDRVYM